jgi:hypothetical protein
LKQVVAIFLLHPIVVEGALYPKRSFLLLRDLRFSVFKAGRGNLPITPIVVEGALPPKRSFLLLRDLRFSVFEAGRGNHPITSHCR